MSGLVTREFDIFIPTVTLPGVGTNFTYTIPQGQGFKLDFLSCTLVCSATAANRFPRFQVKRGSDIISAWLGANVVTAAGVTVTVHNARGLVVNTVSTTSYTMPLPDIPILRPGDTVISNILNLQVDDNISAVGLVFSRYY